MLIALLVGLALAFVAYIIPASAADFHRVWFWIFLIAFLVGLGLTAFSANQLPSSGRRRR
jgi:FtsH-binding integral membrane protein